MDEPIPMTRAEYEAIYGAAPQMVIEAPIEMTREQYQSAYGQPPPVSEPRTFADSLGNIGQSFMRGVEGLGQINPFGPYAASNLGTGITRAFGLEPGPSEGEKLTAARQEIFGEPDYTGAGPVERYAGAGMEMLPYAALGGGPGAAVSSGVGGEISKDLGFDPVWGQLAGGGIYEALKRGGTTFFNMFTAGGREREAGKILEAAVGEEGARRLRALGAGSPELTMAEVAKTPGAANLQMQLGKEIGPGNIIRQALDERAASRIDDLKDLAPGALEGITPDVRGAGIRTIAQPINAAAKEAEEAAWQAVGDLGKKFDITAVANEMRKIAKDRTEILGVSGGANKVMNAILSGKVDDVKSSLLDQFGNPIRAEIDEAGRVLVSPEYYQKIRSAAGEVMAEASNYGHAGEASVMAGIRSGLDDAVERAVTEGKVRGPELQKLQNAISVTRNFKQTYEAGAMGQLMKKGEAGYSLRDSAIPQKVTSTPEAAKQFVRAYGHMPEMMGQGRAALVDDMARKQSDTWVKYFTEKSPQFKALFQDDFAQVEKVFKNLASEQGVGQLAQKATGRGSITSQAQTTMNYLLDSSRILRATQKAATVVGVALGARGGTAEAVVGGLAGSQIAKLAGYAEQDIRMALARAVVKPGFAAKLLAKPTASLTQEVAEVVLPILGSSAAQDQRERQRPLAKSQAPRQSPNGQAATKSSSPQAPQVSSPSLKNDAPPAAATQPQTSPRSPNAFIDKAINRASLKIEGKPLSEFRKAADSVVEDIVGAVIKQESSGKPKALGSVVNVGHGDERAEGLMQILPSTAKDIAKELGVKKYDLKDPETNKLFGTYYLKKLLTQFDGDMELALTAYHTGPGRVENLLKIHKGSSLKDIRKHLGPVGRKYAQEVISRLTKAQSRRS